MSMKWIASLTAIFGSLGVGALFLLPGAAGILTVITSFLAPVAKGLGELLSWLLGQFLDGMRNALDTLSAIFFVVAIVGATFVYSEIWGPKRMAAENEVVLMKKQIEGHKKLIDDLRRKCGDRCRGR
jgi:hypothetical protein